MIKKLLLAAALLVGTLPAFGAIRSVLQVTVGATPAAELNFAANTATGCASIAACISVTRTTAETCTDASGNITYATSGNACITSAGLQVWASGSNPLTHSALDSGWTLTNATASVNATPPDGNANTAATLTDNSTNAGHNDLSPSSVTYANGTSYVTSCFIKGGTLGFAQIYMPSAQFSGVPGVTVNLSTGATQTFGSTITASGAIAYANSWWRVYLVSPATATGGGGIFVALTTAIGNTRNQAYVGTSQTIQLWGCQVEVSGTGLPTPYMPTTTATATRNADNIAAASTLSSTVNSATGTLVITAGGSNQSDTSPMYDSNGTNLVARNVGNNCITSLGATLATSNTATWTSTGNICGLAWDGSGGIVQLNGGTTATDAQARTPSATQHIGSLSGTSQFFGGYITDIRAYSTKLASPQ